MAHVRGLHEARGLQTLRMTAKADPAKLTAKLARLDHQRTLLDRQLAVWTEKQQVTRQRLGILDKQMAQVGRLIRGLVSPVRDAKQRHRKGVHAPVRTMENAAAGVRRDDMSVEY